MFEKVKECDSQLTLLFWGANNSLSSYSTNEHAYPIKPPKNLFFYTFFLSKSKSFLMDLNKLLKINMLYCNVLFKKNINNI